MNRPAPELRTYGYLEREVAPLWFRDRLNTAQIARTLRMPEPLADRIVARLVTSRYLRLRGAGRI